MGLLNKGMPIRYDCGCIEYPVVGHEMFKTPNWIVCSSHQIVIKLQQDTVEALKKKGEKHR